VSFRAHLCGLGLLLAACGLTTTQPKSVKDGEACSLDDDCKSERCSGGYCGGGSCGCGDFTACGTEPKTSSDCRSGWKCVGSISTATLLGVCRKPCSAGCPSTWTCNRDGFCVYIPPEPTPPAVTLDTVPAELEVGQDAGFKCSATTVNGSITSITWQFGDGETASGAEVSHVYSQVALFTVQATATDSANAIGSASASVRVCLPLGSACYPFDQRGNCCTGKRCASGADGGSVCQN
jgi:hypothetical protein